MRKFVSSARGLIGFISLFLCLILSFQGLPFALVSWIGFFILMTEYAVAFTTVFHSNDDSPSSGAGKFLLVCKAFAVVSLGGAVIRWGGLASISIGELPFNLQCIGAVLAAASGIFVLRPCWVGQGVLLGDIPVITQ